MTDPLEEYPRQFARTRGFSLGVPRSFTVSPDGERVAFLRTRAGDDPVSCLWVFDTAAGHERCVFDPSEHDGLEDDERLTEAERARRERARERSSGVTAYATDRGLARAVFAVSGRMYLADLVGGSARELTTPGSVDDPRLDPSGDRVAFVVDGSLHVREVEGGNRVLAADDDPDLSWGLAEFAAAEEMDRRRGHWWSPDGSTLAAARIDERPVLAWYITDQTDPAAPPRAVRYPQAGTADAIVSLHLFDVATGDRIDVRWDVDAFPYLGRFHWSGSGPPLALVVSRDQRRTQLLELDPATGTTSLVRETTDPEWVDLDLPGTLPARLDDGRVIEIVADRDTDTNRLCVDGLPVTPPGLQVRSASEPSGDAVAFRASEDPTEVHAWRWSASEGSSRLTDAPGVHAVLEEGPIRVVVSATLDSARATTTVSRHGALVGEVASTAEVPVVEPKPTFHTLGERDLPAALLLPEGREPDGPLPVLLDPYGGPHGARVLKSAGQYPTSQWLADHGFAVLVVDGRGVDGRGPAWDRAVRFDFTLALEDQVDALHAASERFDFLDLSRVAIRGWSFGGYLSAMAVLRRPEVFHAAVVGAPVTDMGLYDTFYTERYLGHPDEHPDAYARSSILADAPGLERPMLLIHGLADDNVFVAHTLRLSAALFEAGRRHELVLIPNATHLTRSEAVTENLLRVQLDFLRRSLGV
ncbi:MAG TPA: prolyl oligopeptidase family serine peptidase [Actinomycetota bacterium]